MPRRTDIESICLIGSGPIVIGQACEFDYAGCQALKVLREDGFRTIVVNSNPATIMTDPALADRTYLEPLTPAILAKIIERERPDALLPTLGGQTGLNLAMAVAENGVLERYGVQMIGADRAAIHKAENRAAFKAAMEKIGLDLPRSGAAHTIDEAERFAREIGFPVIVRPAFTLGGTGGGTAYNLEELLQIAAAGLEASPVTEILVEESVIGWKEFELEVMRDRRDNVVIICSIENFDPMGVHTGDSITVAPAQTLTDKEYQLMRDAAIACIREIGVETGGSNIQFALNPANGRMVVIEMNPRVSRSSALASKATGFPIAKFAAKLAVGYTLDEIRNDITQETPACFEPTIDYCVVKIPRFAFEKFRGADATLTTQMKSVGETMAIGRSFKESLQKALRGLETGRPGLGLDPKSPVEALADDSEGLTRALRVPNPERLLAVRAAYRAGWSTGEINAATHIDPWFLENIRELVDFERELAGALLSRELLTTAKRLGYCDRQIALAAGTTPDAVAALREEYGLQPVYKLVDTCAAEFEAYTPYYYSTWDDESEVREGTRERIMILGGGPNRIGQGIEFDYCCVHAAFAAREIGYESIMVNSNPETVSTDYDTSDHLFFEPLTHEDVLNVVRATRPRGIIVQFGGQTPLNLAEGLARAGAPLIGTSVESIDRAEDRQLFAELLRKLGLKQPDNGLARSPAEAFEVARRIGYPVLVRPSYVLGGRAMEIVYDDGALDQYMQNAVQASPDRPVLVDKFLEEAIEVDVDAVCDGRRVVIAGVMEHIEEAGVHSGDSTCVLPPHTLDRGLQEEIRAATHAMAKELAVIGLMNVQFAVKGDQVYVLEVNPRASRTVPFVAKAIGLPLAKIAAKVMCGKTLEELGFTEEVTPPYFSVKVPVFPFSKFRGCDVLLGPEMRSTGEVMGIDEDLGQAFVKGFEAAGMKLPRRGKVFLSVKNADKRAIVGEARELVHLGYELCATEGTWRALKSAGVKVERVNKVHEGRPHIVDLIKNREIDLVLNTPLGRQQRIDDSTIRAAAVQAGVTCITTRAGIAAVVQALGALHGSDYAVKRLQDHHRRPSPAPARAKAKT